MSTSNISGRPEKLSARSGRAPVHHRSRDGVDEYRYNPADLLPGNVAQLDEVIRAVQGTSEANIEVAIIGQLSEPYENYEPEDTTLYHPHTVRRVNLLRGLQAAKVRATLEANAIRDDGGIPDVAQLERDQLRETLSQATNHEWSAVYTVYIAEWVRAQ